MTDPTTLRQGDVAVVRSIDDARAALAAAHVETREAARAHGDPA